MELTQQFERLYAWERLRNVKKGVVREAYWYKNVMIKHCSGGHSLKPVTLPPSCPATEPDTHETESAKIFLYIYILLLCWRSHSLWMYLMSCSLVMQCMIFKT